MAKARASKADGVTVVFLKYDGPFKEGEIHTFPKASAHKLVRYGVARLATPEERAKA